MTIDQIDREIQAVMAALAKRDILAIDENVRHHCRWLAEILMDRDCINTQRAQQQYDRKLSQYEKLIDVSIGGRNAYITKVTGCTRTNSEPLFTSVLEILISLDLLWLSSADKARLCKALLGYLSDASEENAETFDKIRGLLASADPDRDHIRSNSDSESKRYA